MPSVAQLKDKFSNPFYKRQAAFLTAFSKGLTSSVPSQIARRRKKLSVTKPEKYLKLAHPPKKPPTPQPPPYVPKRIQLLLARQDDQGRWKPTLEVLQAIGGYVPRPPDRMGQIRWTTALVLVFLRRHPEYWFATETAVLEGEQYVADSRLLKTAAKALPPGFADKAGQYNDRLDRRAVLEGRWKESEQMLLSTVGYQGFVYDADANCNTQQVAVGDVFDFVVDSNDEEAGVQEQQNVQKEHARKEQNLPNLRALSIKYDSQLRFEEKDKDQPRLIASGSASNSSFFEQKQQQNTNFDASQNFKRDKRKKNMPRSRFFSKKNVVKTILRPKIPLKTGIPMDVETRKFLKQKIESTTKYHENVYNTEVALAAKRRPFYHAGEQVQVKWRRQSRWQLPRETAVWHNAKVVRMRANGTSVGVKFTDDAQETDLNVPVEHVRGYLAKDFSDFAWLQRKWEKPRKQAAEKAHVRRKYQRPKQPRWKSCINLQNTDGPEESYLKVQSHKRLEAERLQVAHREEADILSRMLAGEIIKEDLYATASPSISPTSEQTLRAEKRQELRRLAQKFKAASESVDSEQVEADASSTIAMEQEIIQKVLIYESHLAMLKRTVTYESHAYSKAVMKEVKLHAFDGTTQLLVSGRRQLIDLVLTVEKWHSLSHHKKIFPVHPEYCPKSPGSGTPPPWVWEPPFLWNGTDLYVSLVRSLNFLRRSAPLVDCFGSDFPWRANPFSIACDLSMRPQTPRTGMLMRKVDGKDLMQKSQKEWALRETELKQLKEWITVMKKAAGWWPSIKPHACNVEVSDTKMLRAAEKALTGTFLAIQKQNDVSVI